ncbi:MAG: Dehydrogenase-like protein [Parcubacteria group bacterium GW2011_GWA2_47_21]|nr:MAG: Dehydrogenase-like protein [Parcubacteria group bacterium GW2011_GWA2_47_21]
MIKVKIIGAGSIGNHHTQASRAMGWDVTVTDADPKALERMRTEIYPKRYGAWDETIKLVEAGEQPRGGFDIIYIGTPPHVRMKVAIEAIKEEPKVLQLEKPAASPTLEGVKEFVAEMKKHPNTAVIVGFNHIVADNTNTVHKIIKENNLGKLLALESGVRSHWGNILKAHPWLKGPEDTYLGYWKKGGGAGGEHSHALNLWQHFSHELGFGRVIEVQGMFDYVKENGADYDRQCLLNLKTEKGLVGRVVQDVLTDPKKKWVDLRFENGSVEWWNDVTKTTDEVIVNVRGKEQQKIVIEKTRTEEFLKEAQHIADLLSGKIKISDSPIRFERGMETSVVLAAAHESYAKRLTMKIDYSTFR